MLTVNLSVPLLTWCDEFRSGFLRRYMGNPLTDLPAWIQRRPRKSVFHPRPSTRFIPYTNSDAHGWCIERHIILSFLSASAPESGLKRRWVDEVSAGVPCFISSWHALQIRNSFFFAWVLEYSVCSFHFLQRLHCKPLASMEFVFWFFLAPLLQSNTSRVPLIIKGITFHDGIRRILGGEGSMTHSFCIRYNIVDMSMETSILVSRLPVDVSADEVNYRPDIEVDERLLW